MFSICRFRYVPMWIGFSVVLLLLGCQQESGSTPSPSQDLTTSGMNTSISAALLERDPVNRMLLLSTALGGLNADNVEGASAAFSTHRNVVGEFDIYPFMSQWATFDPEAAIEFSAVGLREGSWRRMGYKSIITAWVVSRGAEEAFAYSEKLKEEDSPISQAIDGHLVQALILNGDFAVGMPLLEQMPEGTARNSLLLSLTFELARREGLAKLVEWANSIPSDAPNNLKGTVFSQVMATLTKTDPELAAGMYDDARYEDYVRGDTLAIIATEWLNRDPIASIEWALSQPPSDARDAAVRGHVYRWQMNDSENSEPWLREHLSDPAMKVALYPFAQWLVYQNPVEALAWGMRVPDQREREYVMQQSFLRWRRDDYTAAMDWFANADLSRQLRREIEGLIKMESPDSTIIRGSGVVEEADLSEEP